MTRGLSGGKGNTHLETSVRQTDDMNSAHFQKLTWSLQVSRRVVVASSDNCVGICFIEQDDRGIDSRG